MIYLDANATHPPREEIFPILKKYQEENWFNPSALYSRSLREKMEEARSRIASFLEVGAEEIFFTSGATEANNTSLFSLAQISERGKIALVGSIEHPSVETYLLEVEKRGMQIRKIPVSSDGIADLEAFQDLVETLDIGFVTHTFVNTEVGTIQPIQEMAEILKEKGIPFHVDGVGAVGRIPVSLSKLPLYSFSFSGHKLGAAKGVGVLYVAKQNEFFPLLKGGGQEQGRRSGTENLPPIFSLGEIMPFLEDEVLWRKLEKERNQFEEKILSEIPSVERNGNKDLRVCNTCNLSFENCNAAALVLLLNEKNLYCSAGSACMAGSQEISSSFRAMKIPEIRAKNSLRFSFPLSYKIFPLEEAFQLISDSVKKIREVQGSEGTGPVLVHQFNKEKKL